jgi:L-lactate dehydrogenase
MPLSQLLSIAEGDYSDLADAGIVIIAAGINEKAGGATDRDDRMGRLRLLEPNVRVFEDIVPKIAEAAPRAVLLVATDPPEPLVDAARALAGHERVFGTGTYIDSLRFRVHLAARLNVHPASVEAFVIGEHGTSGVLLWSTARIGGMSIQDALARRRIPFDRFREVVERDVRYANIRIIEGIGASQYGIGIVTARLAEAVLWDEQTVLPVGSYSQRYGVTLSLPSIVGRAGANEVLWPDLSDDEARALERSADTLRDAVREHATTQKIARLALNG